MLCPFRAVDASLWRASFPFVRVVSRCVLARKDLTGTQIPKDTPSTWSLREFSIRFGARGLVRRDYPLLLKPRCIPDGIVGLVLACALRKKRCTPSAGHSSRIWISALPARPPTEQALSAPGIVLSLRMFSNHTPQRKPLLCMVLGRYAAETDNCGPHCMLGGEEARRHSHGHMLHHYRSEQVVSKTRTLSATSVAPTNGHWSCGFLLGVF